MYGEKCHDGKEESIDLGSTTVDKTRMLETLIGKKQDLVARISRGSHELNETKTWLWKSTRRTKALVAQITVE